MGIGLVGIERLLGIGVVGVGAACSVRSHRRALVIRCL